MKDQKPEVTEQPKESDCKCEDCKEDCKCEECECTECEECGKENEVLTAQLEQEKNARMTVLADFINYRKRADKEKEELRVTANKEMLQHIIEVIADFDRALGTVAEADQKSSFYEGVVVIQKKLNRILEHYGLKELDLKEGADFNPAHMEAIATAPATGKIKSGKVLQVFQKGYVFTSTGQIYRTAKVVIAK